MSFININDRTPKIVAHQRKSQRKKKQRRWWRNGNFTKGKARLKIKENKTNTFSWICLNSIHGIFFSSAMNIVLIKIFSVASFDFLPKKKKFSAPRVLLNIVTGTNATNKLCTHIPVLHGPFKSVDWYDNSFVSGSLWFHNFHYSLIEKSDELK